MRGSTDPQLAMLTSLSEERIPADHPIRLIRVVVDAVLAGFDSVFDGMYATFSCFELAFKRGAGGSSGTLVCCFEHESELLFPEPSAGGTHIHQREGRR